MATPYRNVGSIESTGALVSATDQTGAAMDYDAVNGYAQITAKASGVGASLGLRFRAVVAGVLTTLLSFAPGSATAAFAGDVTVANTMTVAGNGYGVAAFGGTFYNHVMVAVGYDGNPLNQLHQVGVYSAVQGNSYATGSGSFIAGFESAIGTQAGSQVVERIAHFNIASFILGAGTTVTRTVGVSMVDETAGTHNAFIAYDSPTFTGNWFIYYDRTRPSLLGGDLTVNGALTAGGLLSGTTYAFSGSGTLGPEVSRSTDSSYLRLWGGNFLGANILIGGDSFSAGNRRTVQISTTSPTSPTGNDGCVLIATQSGTAIMDRTALLTLPQGLKLAAGSLQLANAYVAGAPTVTGYVTLKDSTGATYKVAVGT